MLHGLSFRSFTTFFPVVLGCKLIAQENGRYKVFLQSISKNQNNLSYGMVIFRMRFGYFLFNIILLFGCVSFERKRNEIRAVSSSVQIESQNPPLRQITADQTDQRYEKIFTQSKIMCPCRYTHGRFSRHNSLMKYFRTFVGKYESGVFPKVTSARCINWKRKLKM